MLKNRYILPRGPQRTETLLNLEVQRRPMRQEVRSVPVCGPATLACWLLANGWEPITF